MGRKGPAVACKQRRTFKCQADSLQRLVLTCYHVPVALMFLASALGIPQV